MKLAHICPWCCLLHHACREEIASCSEASYTSLKLADAQKLLMLPSRKETEAYAKQVGHPCCQLHASAAISTRLLRDACKVCSIGLLSAPFQQ